MGYMPIEQIGLPIKIVFWTLLYNSVNVELIVYIEDSVKSSEYSYKLF